MTAASSAGSPGPRVAVVGAGVLGLTAAWRLAQAGARVVVFEAAPSRPNASAIAAGMIAPAAECLAEPALGEIAPFLRSARRAWTGIASELDVPLAEHGTLFAGEDGALSDLAARLDALGFLASRAGPEAAGEPSGLLAPEDALLCAPAAMAALRVALERAGGEVRPGRVEWDGERLVVAGGPIEADAVVLATGAPGRTSGLAPELAWLSPIKGQLLRWAGPNWAGPAGAEPPTRRFGDGVYLALTHAEAVLGATMEAGRDDLEPDAAALQRHLEEAAAFAARLGEGEPAIAVGVRAATPDGLPLVGPSSRPGVWLATGARRNGWLLAPLVADLVTAQVLGRPAPELASLARRLHPGRFEPGRSEKDFQ